MSNKHAGKRRDARRYDVQMIQDFLGQLLLELRLQHYETLKLQRSLKSTDDFDSAMRVVEDEPPEIADRVYAYRGRRQTTLITAYTFDGRNATKAESMTVMREVVKEILECREAQIGHLEALQKLFVEAIGCSMLPYGLDEDGEEIGPRRVHNVREILDRAQEKPAN